MKLGTVMLLLCVPVPALVFYAGSVATQRTKPAETTVFDPAKPHTWATNVNHAKNNLDQIARDLISVAKDKKRSDEERRKAILLLAAR